jgi:hypothetical protein
VRKGTDALPYLRITYTIHARDQMADRQITEAEVADTLNAPERQYPGQAGTLIAERTRPDRSPLRVVYTEWPDGTSAHVVTAFPIRRLSP